MRYILLIILLILITGCDYEKEVEDYNYIPDNSIRFIRGNNDTSILMYKDNRYYLFLLGENNFLMDVDYLIALRDVDTDIDYRIKYVLNSNSSLEINDILFSLSDKVSIIFNDMNLCIYIKKLDKNNYDDCDFLYLYDASDDVNITLSDNLSLLIYHSYTRFSFDFMYHLATVWIDSATIDNESYLTLNINNGDYIVDVTKRRGKTIHKMGNS